MELVDINKVKSIYGLSVYIPLEVIKYNIIPFISAKTSMSCERCDKVMCTTTSLLNKLSVSWIVKFDSNCSKIYCSNCFV